MRKTEYIFLVLAILLLLYTGLDFLVLNPRQNNNLPMTWNVIGFMICFVLFFFFLLYNYFSNEKNKRRIKKNGVKASGILLSITETSFEINNQPEMLLTFKIESQNHGIWEAKMKEVISFSKLHTLIVGNRYVIYYDPNDKTKIAI